MSGSVFIHPVRRFRVFWTMSRYWSLLKITSQVCHNCRDDFLLKSPCSQITKKLRNLLTKQNKELLANRRITRLQMAKFQAMNEKRRLVERRRLRREAARVDFHWNGADKWNHARDPERRTAATTCGGGRPCRASIPRPSTRFRCDGATSGSRDSHGSVVYVCTKRSPEVIDLTKDGASEFSSDAATRDKRADPIGVDVPSSSVDAVRVKIGTLNSVRGRRHACSVDCRSESHALLEQCETLRAGRSAGSSRIERKSERSRRRETEFGSRRRGRAALRGGRGPSSANVTF